MRATSPHAQPGHRARWPLDWDDDAGQVGGVEVLPFGLLIFVIGSLLIANAWAVVDTKLAVNAASREAVRAFVEAADEPGGRVDADRVAREAVAGHGRDPAKLDVDAPAYGSGRGFSRCEPVTINVAYPVPRVTLPWLGGVGGSFVVRSSHTEVIDPYRSGIEAGGSC